MTERAYYQSTIANFLKEPNDFIIGKITQNQSQDLARLQTNAWRSQIQILKNELGLFDHEENLIFFEFVIPRMGKRVDIILIIEGLVFVVECKIGSVEYLRIDKDQVIDYALDLKHFHEGSHNALVIPMLMASEANSIENTFDFNNGLASLLCCNKENFAHLIKRCCLFNYQARIHNALSWADSRYKPTPTIIEAAQALYQGHKVEDISRNDAGEKNLTETAAAISKVIEHAKANNEKAICFVTGVPGAGKTLAGLNITTHRMRSHVDEHAVFLSGNGPLVDVLREALARDEHIRTENPIGEARRNSKTFIQNIHHFRDEYLSSRSSPIEKVVVFDEAQRAWDKANTAKFMQQKRDQVGFDLSEPEFLIQVMDRHNDWCVIVALIGGGQEINTGEAGLPEWFSALRNRFKHWRVFYSDQIIGVEYTQGRSINEHLDGLNAESNSGLHLGVAIRSFRAEKLSTFVSCVINNEPKQAREIYNQIKQVYPIVITRDLLTARLWLKQQAKGSELFGLVASSGANRLKPDGIHIKAKITPAEWFLNGKYDVRSCQYLEDVATEFDIQGLELDWVGLCWDADFRYVYRDKNSGEWSFNSFKGTKWQSVNTTDRKRYLANAYRVLLTRARQGMVIYVPNGDTNDQTRKPDYYEGIFQFLMDCGLEQLS